MAPMLTMVNHGTFDHDHHGWPWSTMVHLTMVNNGTFEHAFEKWHHSWPWSTMIHLTMVNNGTFAHALTMLLKNGTMADHGQPWLTMVNHGKVYDYALTMLLTMGWSCNWPWSDFDHGQKHGFWQWCHFSKVWSTMV